jgi:hypothetical protein
MGPKTRWEDDRVRVLMIECFEAPHVCSASVTCKVRQSKTCQNIPFPFDHFFFCFFPPEDAAGAFSMSVTPSPSTSLSPSHPRVGAHHFDEYVRLVKRSQRRSKSMTALGRIVRTASAGPWQKTC